MTGPEHYKEAERMLAVLGAGYLADHQQSTAAASVHATLALAAATALNPRMRAADADEWQRTCSTTEAPA